ncbi:MAG: HAMP domain-containing methyl-accepting chemotaxis protein [Pseudomonadota bacterium]
MKQLYRKLSIGKRIAFLLILSLLMALSIASVSIIKMQSIGSKFEDVSNIYKPIIASLYKINGFQFEQALQFEKALVIVMLGEDDIASNVQIAEDQFFRFSNLINQEIMQIRNLVAAVPNNFGNKADIIALVEYLDTIQSKHVQNDKELKILYQDLKDWGSDAIATKQIENLEAYLTDLDKRLKIILLQIDTAMTETTQNVFATQKEAIQIIIFITILALILGFILKISITNGIVKPIKNVTNTMNSLAEGDLEIKITESYFKDDILDMIQSVQVFKDREIARKKLELKQSEEQKIQVKRAKNIEYFTQKFDENSQTVLAALKYAAENLTASSHSLSEVSDSTILQANTAVNAASQTLDNVQAVANTTEELSVSIQKINKLVENSSHNSLQAAKDAKEASKQIANLNQSATEIGDVVNLIKDIAEQTNLLALNSTIEAARAGEFGKGFSVVANEVKNLASETSKATEQISDQIKKLQLETSTSLEVVQRTVMTMDQITQDSTTIVAAIDQQNSATSEISGNVQIACQGTTEVTSEIEKVKSSTTDIENAANEVHKVVLDLNQRSAILQDNIAEFIANIAKA